MDATCLGEAEKSPCAESLVLFATFGERKELHVQLDDLLPFFAFCGEGQEFLAESLNSLF